MIDVIKQTPLVLSKESRDYQIIARLYSALFNVSKMYIDNMQVWNSNIDNKLATLRAKTLNFNVDRVWDLNDLEAVTVCFKYLMRTKGTVSALIALLSIMMKVENIDSTVNGSTISFKDNCITIKIEKDLMTIGILEDLIKYILPAGITYRVIKYVSFDDSSLKTTDVYFVSDNTSDINVTQLNISGNIKKKMYIGDNSSGEGSRQPEGAHTMNTTFIYWTNQYKPDQEETNEEE